jgi:hypothetical protein
MILLPVHLMLIRSFRFESHVTQVNYKDQLFTQLNVAANNNIGSTVMFLRILGQITMPTNAHRIEIRLC